MPSPRPMREAVDVAAAGDERGFAVLQALFSVILVALGLGVLAVVGFWLTGNFEAIADAVRF